MPDFVDVKSPQHGEGQSFKMERKDAEKYIAANPGYTLAEEVKPDEVKAEDKAEVVPEAPQRAEAPREAEEKAVAPAEAEDKAVEMPNPSFRARRSER